MMNSEVNYRLNSYRHALDLEIQKLELQLTHAERKLRHAKLDIYTYLGMIGILLAAEVILLLLMIYYQQQQAVLICGILEAIYFIVICLFLLSLPFLIYGLTKSISILIMNSEKNNQTWLQPAVRHYHGGAQLEEDNTYLMEQQKILWVLGKYTLYRERTKELAEQAGEKDSILTPETVQAEITAMPFYEEIKPADPHRGRASKLSKKISFAVLLGLLLIVFLPILLPILKYLLKV
ncbi:MAG: hypothetical protein ACI4HQ_12130 [Acetatifactor sp.]